MKSGCFTPECVLRSRGVVARRAAVFVTVFACAEAANAASETYVTQLSNINQLQTEKNNSPPYAGTYDNGSELAQYANTGSFGNTPGAAAFRTFTVSGSNPAAALRTLRHGDTFTITAYAGSNPSAGGYIGISFRDSTDYADFFKATDGASEARFQLDDSGGWKLYRSGGSDDSGLGAGADRTMTFTITSPSTFNATIGNVSYYDVDMAAGGGTLSNFTIYSFGDSNPNSFWKSASLQNSGTILLGAGNATKTFSGVIADGRTPTSTSTVSANTLVKAGSGVVTLTAAGTYSGGTIVSNGTLVIGTGGRPGTVNTGNIVVQTNAILQFSRSDTFGGGGTDYNTTFAVNGGTITNGGNFFNTMGPIVLNGGTIGSGGGVNGAFPAFQLRKSVTVLANANPSRITSGGTSGQSSLSTNTVFDVADGAAAQDLIVSGGLINPNGAVSRLTKVGPGVMVASGANTYTGTNQVNEGTLLYDGTNTSASTIVMSNAVIGGNGRIQALTVDTNGVLSPGSSGRGTLTAGGAVTWNGNGSYRWEISDFAGSAGATNGWDLFRGLSSLTIASAVGNEFTIRVVSVTANGTSGLASNFTGLATTQLIAHAQSVSGFAANLFTLDFSGFNNSYAGTWALTVLNSTNLALVYSPPPADIAVLGTNGVLIATGDSSPENADGSDFGSLDLTSSGISRTFSITNSGAGTLNLNGTPVVQVTGAHASDFTVTSQASTPLAAGARTTFTLRFVPGGTGVRQATVSIASDDGDENPYTFAVTGAGTFNSNAFPYRVQVQFCGYNRGETLTNFPALVVLGASVTNFDYNLFLTAGGGDLRFTDGSMTRLLNHEVELWDTNGSSYVWVQVPAFSSTSSVWAMWGNASAATAPAYTTNGATWSDGYVGVWHLGETSGVFKDSASTNSGTLTDANSSSTRGAAGQIGKAFLLVGSEPDFIQIANESNFDLRSNITVEVWQKGLASGDAWSPWVSKLGENGQGYALRRRGVGSPAAPDWVTRGTTTEEQNNSTVSGSSWHFIAGTLGQGASKTKRLIVDGAVDKEDTVTGQIALTDDSLLIGARTNAAAYVGGTIDEVRVSRVERSTNWLWATFQSTASNGAFNCYGEVSGGAEIAVLGTNSAVITDGDSTPAVADGTDFGNVTLDTGTYQERIFTITNSGGAALSLTGSPLVSISGPASADFSLVTPPASSITAAQKTTFRIRFQPTVSGLRSATLTISNTDGDENPYNFNIQGAGVFSPTTYVYRLPLQICGYNRSETLTNFPVAVSLSSNIGGFGYGQFQGSNGGDLRFSDGSQTSTLNFEIETWNTGGVSVAWVQIPALPGTGTTIYAYWGNTSATTLPPCATNGSTWANNFAGVWHLSESSGTSRDSTTNALTGYPSNDVTQAAGGQVGGGDDFGGASSRTFIGSPAVLNRLTNNFSVSAWVRPDVLGGNRVIFGAHWGSLDGWSMRAAGANLGLERLPGGTLTPGVALTAGQWAAVSVVYDTANNATFYINGVNVGTVAGTTPAATCTQPWSIGANDGDRFDGLIDEVQVSQTTRSSNWIWAAYQNTASNTGFICAGALQGPGELIVLGTNGSAIAHGSTSANETNGSDYGYVPVSSYREHTFLLTNAGVGTLTITGVTTSGPHAANFSVRSFPTSLAGLSASGMVVRFTPPGSGTRTAVVSIASSDEAHPTYTFTLVGRDSSAGIAIGPTSLSPSGELGTNFTTTLAVSNIGSISIPYSFTSDVPWITSADAGITFTNAPLAGQSHTLALAFTNPICSAGVYTGRVVITAPLATNSPKVFVVTATVTAPSVPTSVSATASGQEFIRLAWQSAGQPVMIVYGEGTAPNADPSGCSSYAVGSSVGSGVVIYSGTGSGLDHVVRTNATHYYRLYSVKSNQFYSASVDRTATSTAYGDGLIVAESFAYTNGLLLQTRNGGIGWTNAWSVNGSYLVSSGSLGAASGYAGGYGNAVSNAAGSQIFRGIPDISASTGKRYLSFQMRYDSAGFAGVSFFQDGAERAFIGQKSGANEFGLVYYDGSSPTRGVNTMTAGKDYTVIAMIDIANGTISASVYTNESETVPSVEPTTWQVTGTGPTDRILNRLRLGSGVGAAFDEIRIGHTWRDIINPTPYAVDVLPSNLTFHTSSGMQSSSTVFQVVNGNASTYGYTNAVTYGSGATGWLHFSATSAVLTAFSSQTHTAFVSAIGGGGTYVATNRVTTPYGTFTQTVSVTVSGVPVPTSVAVTTNGPQLRGLSWSDTGNRDVMVVYRSGAAPASDPVQGVSYSLGATIPGNGGTVVGKGTNAYVEHVAAAGSTPYYKFFAVNGGIYYSTGIVVAAPGPSYASGVIVDQVAATQGVSLATVTSGQGWSGAWTVSNASGSFTVVTNTAGGTPAFDPFTGFPTNYAHRILMSDQGNGSEGTALREFSAITSGKVYVSAVISYQYPGALKYAGLSLMSAGSERLFFGETEFGGAVFGVEDFGGSGTVNSGYSLNFGSVYTIIGAYDFATREFKAQAYHTSESVPAGEPAAWLIHTNLPAGRITSLNGIRLTAGCHDPVNTVGYTYFDEMRVARTWADLVQRTGPVLTSYSLQGGQPVTDANMTNGSWSVTMNFQHAAGIQGSSLNYDIFTTNSVELASDVAFATVSHSSGGTVATASNGSQVAASGAHVYLGPYYLRWSAESSNGVGVVNSTVDQNNGVVSFTVIDDDTAGPVASGFNVTGRTFTNADIVAGLLVTGLVQDTGSGVFGGSSNRYVLYRNGTQVDAGPFTVAPSSDGAARASAEPLSVTIAGTIITNVGSYSLVVYSRDVDGDRDNDTAAGSNSFAFTVTYFGCPAGIPPTLASLTDKTTTSNTFLSFNVTASDAGCAPSLTSSDIPAGASFSSYVSGSDRIGTFTWTPGTVGTFPIRFTADDGTLSTSIIIRVYVGHNGEGSNGQGIPHSQTNWSIQIETIHDPGSNVATVEWAATNGMTYDVYSSALPMGGGASWTKVVQGQEASGGTATADVAADGTMRFYQVVPEGSARTDRGAWGIVRPSVPSGAITYMAPPVPETESDLDFSGNLGDVLAAALTDPDDRVYIMTAGSNPSWTTLRLVAGEWIVDGGGAYTTPLNPGQGFLIVRDGSSGSPVFSGPVGNDGSEAITLAAGYNIIGISEGRTLSALTAFENASPVGSYNEELADQVIMLNSDGSFRRLWRLGNGTWYDTATRGTTTLTLQPGQAYYYIRRTSDTTLDF